MMSSPANWLTVFAVYLYIVMIAGPRFMMDRKAFKLTNLTRIYNLYQIIACVLFITKALSLGFSFKHGWDCAGATRLTPPLSQIQIDRLELCYWFIFMRASEFFETIVFVLRKKQNQVSFLHVYHHIAVVSLLWITMKYSGTLGEAFIPAFNSIIHIIMYSYYFLSSFESCRKFTATIKSSLTAIQIVQLLVLVFHCLRALIGCGATKLYYLHISNLAFLVYMFVKFYVQSYQRPKAAKKA